MHCAFDCCASLSRAVSLCVPVSCASLLLPMSERPTRSRKAPTRFGPESPDDAALDPPVGSLLVVSVGQNAGDVLLRLVGFREDCGVPRYRLIPHAAPRDHRAEYPSASYCRSYCAPATLPELPRPLQRVVVTLLDDPPTEGLVVRAPRRTPIVLKTPSAGALPLFLKPWLDSRSLHHILHCNPRLPAMSLDFRHYAYRAILRWDLPCHSSTSCVIYGAAESTLRRKLLSQCPEMPKPWLMHRVRTERPPSDVRETLTRGEHGLLPTIPSSTAGHLKVASRMKMSTAVMSSTG